MAYIGNQPAESFTSFATQEFSTSATTSYTLDHAVANENELALFVNNVRQQPGSGKAYTATGTALTLSAATASTDTMYCVFLGRALQTVTPATNSITNTMLSENSQTQIFNNNFRNIIINGDMSVAQRGTSDSSNTTGGYVTCDRWLADIDSQGTWTLSQSTDVPSGQGFSKSFKYDCTTADASPAAGDKINLQQRLEGQMLQYLKKGTSSAESTTLSFWVRSNKTGTYICELQDIDNTRSISKSYTISSADTWEKKTITFAGDTSGALDNDNIRSLDVIWYLGAGSNLTSGTLNTSWNSTTAANRAVGQVNLADSTDNEWYITGVQLEAGTTATNFEFLPVDVNLQRCKRYFQNLAPTGLDNIRMGIGENKNTTVSGVYIKFEPEMRTTPSLSSTAANTFSLYHSATDIVASGINFDSKSSKGGNIDVTVSSGLLDGGASQFLTASTSTRLDFSSEL